MGMSKIVEGSSLQSGLHSLAFCKRARRTAKVGYLARAQVAVLKTLTGEFHLSVALGDLTLLEGKWYVTHSGLMRLARRNRCAGIQVRPIREYCDITLGRWVFRAIVYKTAVSKGFVGYGDADPSNVSSDGPRGRDARCGDPRRQSRPAQSLRHRPVFGRRARIVLGAHATVTSQAGGSGFWQRKWLPSRPAPPAGPTLPAGRQFNLDPTLVKAYAADFCGTETLSEASRDLVGSFIAHLSKAAKEDRDALVCKLNSYGQPAEAKP
jgi:hypothetical protein